RSRWLVATRGCRALLSQQRVKYLFHHDEPAFCNAQGRSGRPFRSYSSMPGFKSRRASPGYQPTTVINISTWGPGKRPLWAPARSHGFQPVVRRPDLVFGPLQGHRHGRDLEEPNSPLQSRAYDIIISDYFNVWHIRSETLSVNGIGKFRRPADYHDHPGFKNLHSNSAYE